MSATATLLTSPFTDLPSKDDTHLFPDSGAVVFSEQEIATLVQQITVATRDDREGTIPAGYTYIGQFVSHDFVPGKDTPRQVLPRLNLDSVYGLDPLADVAMERDHFVLGAPDPLVDGQVIDLARNNGVAQIPEPRNDENVIVAQLHLMFQKIHNELVDRLRPDLGSGQALIDAARKINVYLYHRLLIDDYLPRVLAPTVADYLLARNERFLLPGVLRDVPREFSMAAFRFGHSMVRQRYNLLNGRSFSITELIRRGKPIPASMVLDWDSMFGPAGDNLANGIDTELAIGLTRVDTPRGELNLAELNVRASVGLASGMSILEQLNTNRDNLLMLWRTEMRLSIADDDIEAAIGLKNRTADQLPLWVYFLIEAMCHERRRRRTQVPLRDCPGQYLGPLASLIVGEVLLAGMRTAPFGAFTSQDQVVKNLPGPAVVLLDKLLRPGRISVQSLVREFPSTIIKPRKQAMRKILTKEFTGSCIQGPAVPGLSKWVADELEFYHPPNDSTAANFITRLCRVDAVSESDLPESIRLSMPGLFKLEAVSGWNRDAGRLMASLDFHATYDASGKLYFLAHGSVQQVAGYRLSSWRIDTEDLGDVVRYGDTLHWKAQDGSDLITSWFWDPPKKD